MAQNITLLGASYSAVPAVTLPKTGGGTASFTDVTDTTAVAADVAQGKYFYTAAGVKTEGTASGSSAITVIESPDSSGGVVKNIVAVDISADTVDAAHLVSGYTAHDRYGNAVSGSIASKSSSDLTVSGDTVTAPAGYYASSASKSVASGTAGTPTATKGTVSNHSVSVTPSVTNTTGYITGSTKTGTAVSVSASELVSGTKSITENGTGIDVTNYASVDVNVSGGTDFIVTISYDSQSDMWLPDKTYAEISAAYTAGKTLGINAQGDIYGFYGAWGIEDDELIFYYDVLLRNGKERRWLDYFMDSTGLYDDGYSVSYDTGDADALPTDVSNGKVFYNANGRQTGTASGGMNMQVWIGRASRTANSYGATSATLTVAKTGTYTVSWTAWRSSSSGTMGTNLHVNNTTGTNQQTFTNTYGQQIELTGQHYNAGDVLTIYATSGSTSRTINVSNLIIQQTA